MGEVLIDDFEDGDITVSGAGWSGWGGNTGSFSVTNQEISGVFSGELDSGGTGKIVTATRSSQYQGVIQARVRIGSNTGFFGDRVDFEVGDGDVGVIRFDDGSGDIQFIGASTSTLTSWFDGTVYRIAIRYDNTSDVYAYVNGTEYGPFSPGGSTFGIDEIALINDSAESGNSRSVVIDGVFEDPTVDTPTLTKTSQSDATTDFSYTDVGFESGYQLYRASTPGVTTSDTLADSNPADTASISDTSPGRDIKWYYRIRATGFAEWDPSALSNEVATQEFGDPTIFTDAARETEIDIGVNYPPNAEEIDIYRSQSSGVTTSDQLVGTLTGASTFTDTGLQSGTQYFYVAQARDTDGIFSPSELSNEIDGFTTPPAPVIDSTTADSQSAITVSWTLQDSLQKGDVDVIVDGSVVATVGISTTTYQATGFSEATAHDFEIRRDTNDSTITSDVSTQYTKPTPPNILGVSVNELPCTHTLTWTDNSSGEDGYDIRSVTGSPETIVTNLPAGTTTYTTDRLDRVATYDYQVRAFAGSGDSRAASLSATFSASFPTYDNYWAVIDPPTSSTEILTDSFESGPTYEHTALHGFSHALRESDVDFAGWGPLTHIGVYFDDTRLFDGELIDLDEGTPAPGATRIEGRGPVQLLNRTAPSSKVTYQNVLVYQAIEDYLATEVTTADVSDWTVAAPPGDVVDADVTVLDASTASFSGLYSAPDDVPVDSGGSWTTQRAGLFGVQDDFGGNGIAETPGSGVPHYLDGEYVDVGSGGDPSISLTVTPDHDIPAGRVGLALHGIVTDAISNDVTAGGVEFNGETIDDLGGVISRLPTDDGSTNTDWGTWEGFYTGADLSAGSNYTLTLTPGDTSYNISGMGVYDTKYGPYTFDTPSSFGEKVAGPKLYKAVELDIANESRPNPIESATIAATVTDTGSPFQWRVTTTGGASELTATAEDPSFDFFGNAQYGATIEPFVTIGGTGSNSWLADGASPQEITAFALAVTTVDIAAVSAVELTDSHCRNLKRLHEQAGMRWVVDPTRDRRVDGIVAESFAPDSSVAERSHDWTQLSTSRRRQLDGYANAVTVNYVDANGDDQSFVGVADSDEVARVGEEVRKVVFAPGVSTNDQARNRMLNERRERIARDRVGGTVEIAAKPVLPGYRYDISDFGGYTSLERTRYVESADRATATLQFERDDDVARIVTDTRTTVDSVQEQL